MSSSSGPVRVGVKANKDTTELALSTSLTESKASLTRPNSNSCYYYYQ